MRGKKAACAVARGVVDWSAGETEMWLVLRSGACTTPGPLAAGHGEALGGRHFGEQCGLPAVHLPEGHHTRGGAAEERWRQKACVGDDAKRKSGRRSRMMDLGKKMGDKLEEKRRQAKKKGRHIIEKMCENARANSMERTTGKEKNDNVIESIISKVNIIYVDPSKTPQERDQLISNSDLYYEMSYSVAYSTFETIPAENDGATGSEVASDISCEEGKPVADPAASSGARRETTTLLDLYSGCGAM
ncbi:hypothetical protein ZWY2020_053006 [Hordeum vulgare]|nr:hypothetical protein ZWY2020_053006 [Hordeum vulgare]